MDCTVYTAMVNSFNSYRLLGVAYFSQCIISKGITHTIKPLPVQPKVCVCVCSHAHTIKPCPVQPKVCVCVCARAHTCTPSNHSLCSLKCVCMRARAHTHTHDTVYCSDYTAVNLSPRKSDVQACSPFEYISSMHLLFQNIFL